MLGRNQAACEANGRRPTLVADMKYRFTLVDRLILLAPFLIPFVVCVGVVVGVIAPNGLLDTRFAFILSIIFALYMLIMLWRASTFESPTAQEATGLTARKVVLLIVLSFIGAGVAYLLLWTHR
jgi:hypothetical protein